MGVVKVMSSRRLCANSQVYDIFGGSAAACSQDEAFRSAMKTFGRTYRLTNVGMERLLAAFRNWGRWLFLGLIRSLRGVHEMMLRLYAIGRFSHHESTHVSTSCPPARVY